MVEIIGSKVKLKGHGGEVYIGMGGTGNNLAIPEVISDIIYLSHCVLNCRWFQ